MSAYVIAPPGRPLFPHPTATTEPLGTRPRIGTPATAETSASDPSGLNALIADLAQRVAAEVVEQLGWIQDQHRDEWLDSRSAAGYLGVHRDTLRKLAAERTIPTHQDGPGCKLFFRRSDLDAWRQAGGRVVQLPIVDPRAA